MNAEEAVLKYPDLEGLYIPETGEIINWGKGCAITTQSPLEPEGWQLLAISLNSDMPFESFPVIRQLAMGPYEALFPEEQVKLVSYYDTNYNGRFSRLFQEKPWVKERWEKYRKAKGV
jgi:hypothetical protein